MNKQDRRKQYGTYVKRNTILDKDNKIADMKLKQLQGENTRGSRWDIVTNYKKDFQHPVSQYLKDLNNEFLENWFIFE